MHHEAQGVLRHRILPCPDPELQILATGSFGQRGSEATEGDGLQVTAAERSAPGSGRSLVVRQQASDDRGVGRPREGTRPAAPHTSTTSFPDRDLSRSAEQRDTPQCERRAATEKW
ncbi:hypothetical protein GCM10009674_13360 [Nesterenkonia xinjiangensis]